MNTFEYATVVFNTADFWVGSKLDHQAFNRKLNEYGARGWELVNAFDMNWKEGVTFEVVAVFKRPLGARE